MRYVVIEKAEESMVLARPIFDGSSRVLLGTNTILTKDYIDRLMKLGLPGFYVEDELASDIEIDDTITPELRNEGVEALRSGNIDKTMEVAKGIVEQILSKAVVSLDLVDLRTFDDYTYRHSVNVAVLSTIIGINMDFNQFMLQELCVSAILHDIGKLMVPPEILNKPEKLTDDEFFEVKKHPDYAFGILKKRMDISARTRAGVLSHHENEDGTGYPYGLIRDQIYIYAKIIHVADVFDALTSRRPYKMPYPRSEAVEYLMGSCDRLFDREVVMAFIKSVPIYPKGTMITLSDGREGLVIGNSDNVLRPVIRLLDGTQIDLGKSVQYRSITIVQDAVPDQQFV